MIVSRQVDLGSIFRSCVQHGIFRPQVLGARCEVFLKLLKMYKKNQYECIEHNLDFYDTTQEKVSLTVQNIMKYTTIITQDHAFISLNHRHETRIFYHITNTKPHFSVISQTKDFTFLSQIHTTMTQTQFLLSSKIILFYPNMETRYTCIHNNDTGPHFLITYRYMTHIVTTKMTQNYMILSNH